MGRVSFNSDFRKFFGKGLGILLPTVLTLWILVQLAMFLNNKVGQPINRGVQLLIIEVTPRVVDDANLPAWFRVSDEEVASARTRLEADGGSEKTDSVLRRDLRRDKFQAFWGSHWYMEAAGLIIAIVLIYFSGLLLGGYIGRQLYTRLEGLLRRLPGFKQVYPHVKQVTELVLGDSAMAFSRVVLVEYPRKGIWTVGLVTGHSLRSVSKEAGSVDVLSVFIPSTPAPFTGFTINLPCSDVIDVPIQVDEAIRYFITGGVLVPEAEARDPKQISHPDDETVDPALPDGGSVADQIRSKNNDPKSGPGS